MSIPERQVLLEHVGFLRAIALGVLRNEADADDAVQQTLATALQKPPADDSNIRGWLATVVRNFARMQLRSRGRRHAREEAVARREGGAPSAAQIAQRMEMERHVVDAIAALEEPFRTTLILRFYDDLQPKEIALRMDVPAATVRTRLKRGLDKLRAQLEEKNGGSRRATYAGLLLLAQLPARAAPLKWLPIAAVFVGIISIVALVAINSEDAPDSVTRTSKAERPTDGDEQDPANSAGVEQANQAACVVKGTVLDSERKPLADVEVIAYEHAGASLLDTPMNRWRRWTEPPAELARTTTGVDGDYTLRIEPARPFWIVYQRSGSAARVLPVSEGTGEYSGVDVMLRPSPGVKGWVTDDEGSPVPGAVVHAWTPEYTMFGAPALISATTGESGKFTLPFGATYFDGLSVEPNRLWIVVDARTAGYAPRVFCDRSPVVPHLTLRRHGSLKVRTEPGTQVVAFGDEAIDLARAADDGVATFPEFPDGERILVFLHRGFVPRQVRWGGSERTIASVPLARGVVLSGLLQREGTSQPFVSAAVGVAERGAGYGMLFDTLDATHTAPDGSFQLRAAAADDDTIVVAHPALAPRHRLNWPPVEGQLRGAAITLTLPAEEELQGRVVNAWNAPVAGARVRIRRPGFVTIWVRDQRRLWTAITREDGSFLIRGIPRTRSLMDHARVSVWHPIHGAAHFEGLPTEEPVLLKLGPTVVRQREVAPDKGEVDPPATRAPIKLDGVRPLAGRVMHAGEPVEGAAVRVVYEGTADERTRTDRDGRFSLERWPMQGARELVVETPGFLTVRLENPTGGDIELTRAAQHVVHVVDEQGLSRSDVELLLGERRLVSDRHGIVRLYGARETPPEFVVVAGGPGWIGVGDPRWSEDGQVLTLVVRRGERIEGRVVDSENRGVPHTLVLAHPTAKGHTIRRAFTNSQGYFVLRALYPERYELRVGAAERGVDIEAGATELVLREESR